MEFLIDECAGPSLARWLRNQGHNVVSVYETARGADDGTVLSMAVDQSRVLITADKGFGERIFKSRAQHCGVILLRLRDERPAGKIRVVQRILHECSDRLADNFLVATEKSIRITDNK